MSTSRKQTPLEELERIEDALVDSILNLSGGDLREEFADTGIDIEACVSEIETTFAVAKAEYANKRLLEARAELAAWRKRASKATAAEIDEARAKLVQIRSGNQELGQRMMLAARKGEGLSDSDMEALLEDLVALKKLEGKQEDE